MHRHINISMLQALKWIIHDNWGTGDFIITFKISYFSKIADIDTKFKFFTA